MTPGLHHGLSIEQYHGGPGVSKSGLDDIARCPAAYFALHLDPERPPREEKPGQLEGNLAHCAVLEPDQLLERYVVGPDVSRATKDWKLFVADNPGRRAIKPDQYATAIAQARSVRRLPEVAELLSSGQAEVSAFWIDEDTGELCRVRPDWVHPVGSHGVILVDLKTYTDASAVEFKRQVARKRYHVQDAFYSEGYERASGREVLAFVFVAVETAWPFLASAVMLDAEGKETGRRLFQRDLATYSRCRAENAWPGFGNSIDTINLPRWALSE